MITHQMIIITEEMCIIQKINITLVKHQKNFRSSLQKKTFNQKNSSILLTKKLKKICSVN